MREIERGYDILLLKYLEQLDYFDGLVLLLRRHWENMYSIRIQIKGYDTKNQALT